MVISGLNAAVQPATLAVNVAGPLVDAFALISNPRLHLLGDRPVALESETAGNIDTHVDLTLPLKDKVLASDVTVKVHAQLTGVALHKLLLGRDLTDGSCTIDANTSQLNVQGHANITTNPPFDLTLYSDFRRGPPDQVQTRVNVKGAADTTRLAAAGLPMVGWCGERSGLPSRPPSAVTGAPMWMPLRPSGKATCRWRQSAGAAGRRTRPSWLISRCRARN